MALPYKCVILLLLNNTVAIVQYCPGKWPAYTYMTKVSYRGQHFEQQQEFLVLRPAHVVMKEIIQVFHTNIIGIILFCRCILTKCVLRYPVNTLYFSASAY
jgi:hypothetical protein